MRFVLILLFITNSFLFAMESSVPKKYPFHELVKEVAQGHLAGKSAIEKMRELTGKNPNDLDNYRTAAQLSAYYYLEFTGISDEQFFILKFLLENYPENKEENRKRIIEDLEEIVKKIRISEQGFRRAPFSGTKVSGGGSFIDDKGEKEVEERRHNKEQRIQSVEELLFE